MQKKKKKCIRGVLKLFLFSLLPVSIKSRRQQYNITRNEGNATFLAVLNFRYFVILSFYALPFCRSLYLAVQHRSFLLFSDAPTKFVSNQNLSNFSPPITFALSQLLHFARTITIIYEFPCTRNNIPQIIMRRGFSTTSISTYACSNTFYKDVL